MSRFPKDHRTTSLLRGKSCFSLHSFCCCCCFCCDFCYYFSLRELAQTLALEMVRDGEGATKLVSVRVINASSRADAAQCAKTIANSMLVKTALFGSDGNWGRIMAAGEFV